MTERCVGGPSGYGGCPFRKWCKREYERNVSDVQRSHKISALPEIRVRRRTTLALADFTVHMQMKVQT